MEALSKALKQTGGTGIGDGTDGPKSKKPRTADRHDHFQCQWPGCKARPRRTRSQDKGASGFCG